MPDIILRHTNLYILYIFQFFLKHIYHLKPQNVFKTFITEHNFVLYQHKTT